MAEVERADDPLAAPPTGDTTSGDQHRPGGTVTPMRCAVQVALVCQRARAAPGGRRQRTATETATIHHCTSMSSAASIGTTSAMAPAAPIR
jgi:hypothetical protein